MVHEIRPQLPCYVYIELINELFHLPGYPTGISDSTGTNWALTTPLSRSAPIYSFSNAGPRSFLVLLDLHRDVMMEVNMYATAKNLQAPKLDYIDELIKGLYAMALPNYGKSQKMVDPPVICVRLSDDLYCRGVVSGVGVSYAPPILKTGKYACVSINFTISEIDPYDAEEARLVGGYRDGSGIKLSTSLDSPSYTAGGGGGNNSTAQYRATRLDAMK